MVKKAKVYKCTIFKVVCLQITVILAMSLLPWKQRFHKAMCICMAMGVLSAELIMSLKDRMWVGVCCHGNKVFIAKSHTVHYYCPKRHMHQMPSKEAVRVSLYCHGNEVSVVTGHTIDQYCVRETVNQKANLQAFKQQSYPGMPLVS